MDVSLRKFVSQLLSYRYRVDTTDAAVFRQVHGQFKTIVLFCLLTDRPPRVAINRMRSRRGRHVTKSVAVDLAASVTVVVIHLDVKLGPALSREK